MGYKWGLSIWVCEWAYTMECRLERVREKETERAKKALGRGESLRRGFPNAIVLAVYHVEPRPRRRTD